MENAGIKIMSICQSGIDCNIAAGKILVEINEEHPLIQLAQVLPWRELLDLILSDLKKTKEGKWWLGRKLKVRMHLGVYLLQQLFNKTDREMEYDVKDNAAYQIFCGKGIVDKWHAPDHTKIENFRSRLSAASQQALANKMATHAVKIGFGNGKDIDIDSTVQEAHMAYPADSCLLKKLAGMANKVSKLFNKTLEECIVNPIKMNMKKIGSKARAYFFLPKNATKETKNEKLTLLLNIVQKETKRVVKICENLGETSIKKIKWNYARTILQIKALARQYFKDVKKFIKTGSIVTTKILSFHLKEVACFTKRKLGKKYQFGRGFQLGRTDGNFFFVAKCDNVQMSDKTSLSAVIEEHQKIFEDIQIDSVSTDKGYYSKTNEKFLAKKGVNEIGIQRPCNIKKPRQKALSKNREEELINRRSGIEPLIGHIKQKGQLGRSRMKSDRTAESSGYAAVLGFNMRQLIRHQKAVDRGKISL
jgi:transposase, IS5 family